MGPTRLALKHICRFVMHRRCGTVGKPRFPKETLMTEVTARCSYRQNYFDNVAINRDLGTAKDCGEFADTVVFGIPQGVCVSQMKRFVEWKQHRVLERHWNVLKRHGTFLDHLAQ